MSLWVQPIDPVGFLPLSCLAALTPILSLIAILCIFRAPSWKAIVLSSIIGFAISLIVYRAPISIILSSYLYGLSFGFWPISWIVVNAIFLYNVARKCGCIDRLIEWMKNSLPINMGLYAIFIAFLLGGLIEGVDGYGFPIAISTTLLVSLGFKPIEAVCISLIANTVTVPFASLGVPVETLSTVSNLDLKLICIYLSLYLALISVATPILIISITSNHKDRRIYEAGLLSGITLAISMYIVTIYMDPRLSGILAPIASILATILYVKFRFRCRIGYVGLDGWIPWIIVSVAMGFSNFTRLYRLFSCSIPIPSIHKSIYIPLYDSLVSAVYEIQPLAHGSLILISAIIVACIYKLKPLDVFKLYVYTWRRMKHAVVTIMGILGLAFLMNYTGLSLTLGYTLSYTGLFYPLLSGFIGWIGTFVSGSETGSNALFGNLQRMAAEISGITPYITTSLNAAGGVLGKMVSLQSIAIGLSTVGLKNVEGVIMRRLIGYSLALTLILGLTTYVIIALV